LQRLVKFCYGDKLQTVLGLEESLADKAFKLTETQTRLALQRAYGRNPESDGIF
jgi:hypothetical protein